MISTIMHRIKGKSAKRISDYLLTGSRGFNASAKTTQINRRGIPARHCLASGVAGGKAPPTQPKISTRDAIKIWQPSFYDFNIYSEKKLRGKFNYIYYNPVRAGLVKNSEDWKWTLIN